MYYNDFAGKQLSALGMGCMRLPVVDGKDACIDVPAAEAMIDYAYENGVNYFDVAWGYHEGNSEKVVGAALAKHPRESFYLATKFPGYDLRNMGKQADIFPKQLEKCGVEYFDFYLIHNVCEMNIEQYLDPKYGLVPYLLEQKAAGRIKHLGFSCHGNLDTLTRFLEAYGEYMEFGQLELNYFDWEFQNAKAAAELLNERNIPIWVMEPVRGGQLAKLSDEDTAILEALRPEETVPGWAFRFLQGIPGVTVTLAGSSTMEQLTANIATYAEPQPLDEAETEVVLQIARDMAAKISVPCTACRYCTKYCPLGIDIPWLLHLYNEASMAGAGDFIAPMALAAVKKGQRPEDCIGCGSCATVCPQAIDIPAQLAAFAKKMGR